MANASTTQSGVPRVNLMPRSEVVRRERESVIRAWVWGVLGAILVALLIIAAALALKFFADQRLVAEQNRSDQLLTELNSLAEVSAALANEQELDGFRTEAMSADFDWTPVVQSVVAILPAEAVLTGFDLTSGGTPQGDEPESEPGLIGTISVDSPTPLDIVQIIRALRDVPGVLAADGQSVTQSSVSEGRFAYMLTVTFDQSIYSGSFAQGEE